MVFTNVTIRGHLDLEETEIAAFVRFNDCRFSQILADRATFKGSLSLAGCTVGRFRCYQAQFNDLRVAGGTMAQFLAANTVFDKNCFLRNVAIGDIFMPASRILGNLEIIKLTAAKSVDLRGTSIGVLCDLTGLKTQRLRLDSLSAQQLDAKNIEATEIGFARIVVKDAVDLTDTKVSGSFDFRSAEIGDDILLKNCRLHDVDLSGTKSGDALFIKETEIGGELAIVEGRFGQLVVSGAVQGEVIISDVSFTSVALLAPQLKSNFVFIRNTISGSFKIELGGAAKTTVAGRCTFANTCVGNQLIIGGLDVGRDFSIASLTANDVLCKDVTVGGDLILRGVVTTQRLELKRWEINGNVNADSLEAANLEMVDCKSIKLVLASARVKGSTELARVACDELSAPHAVFAGDLKLQSAVIASRLNLTRARVGDLCFADGLTEGRGAFHFPPRTMLKDCDYASIRVAWRALMAALDANEDYDASAYRILEAYIRGLGRLDWADEIHLTSRRHAARTLPPGPKRAGEKVLDAISGYGARPWRLLRADGVMYGMMCAVVLIAKSMNHAFITYAAQNWAGAVFQVIVAAFDVVLRGEKGDVVIGLAARTTSWSLFVADLALALRYGILVAAGLFAACFTGLLRYPGGRA